jgi:Domain of unknown function (DUF4389)
VVMACGLLRLRGAGYRSVSAVHSCRCHGLPGAAGDRLPAAAEPLAAAGQVAARPPAVSSGRRGFGSGYVVATGVQHGRAVAYSTPSLIGASVLIAAIAMLFITRYPTGLYDLVVGINRWSYRLVVYIGLMTDRYPPVRLDQSGEDPEGSVQPVAASETSQ